MGIFRYSSVSRTTDATPASATLSARTIFTRYPRLSLAGIFACVGFFAFAAVDATPQTVAPRAVKPVSQSSLNFTATNQQPAASEPAADTTAQSSVETNVSVTSDGMSAPKTNVSVNGQQVPVPENGSVTHTSNDGNTQTTLHVDSSNQGSASNSSSTSLNLNVSSTTNSYTDNNP